MSLKIKTSQKMPSADIEVIAIASRSLTGETEKDAFERIEKECHRLAQDPSYHDDKAAK
jgi:hypothetical protein